MEDVDERNSSKSELISQKFRVSESVEEKLPDITEAVSIQLDNASQSPETAGENCSTMNNLLSDDEFYDNEIREKSGSPINQMYKFDGSDADGICHDLPSTNKGSTSGLELEGDGSKSPVIHERKSTFDRSTPDSPPKLSWKNLVDSDSDDLLSIHDDDYKDSEMALENQTEPIFSDSDCSVNQLEALNMKTKSMQQNRDEKSGPNNDLNLWQKVVDSEDESDSLPSIHENSSYNPTEITRPHSKSKDKNSSPSRMKSIKKMTEKQRNELMKETLSKTQKMIRERQVSLPYEKPQALTLKEFLARRTQAKAEFYNPELKKKEDLTLLPILDLTKLHQPVSLKKVEDWVVDTSCQDNPSSEFEDSAADEFKVANFSIEDLNLVDDDKSLSEKQFEISLQQCLLSGYKEDITIIDLENPKSLPTSNNSNTILEDVVHFPKSPLSAENAPEDKILTAEDETPLFSVQEKMVTEYKPQNDSEEVKSIDKIDILAHEQSVEETEISTCEELIIKKTVDEEAAEKDFLVKEIALEAYFEENKPKPPRKSIAELLKMNPNFSKIANLTPSINPGPKGFVEFSIDAPAPRRLRQLHQNGVETLKTRFIKHTVIPKPKEQHFTVVVTTKEEDSQGNHKSIVNKVDYVQHFNGDEGDQVKNTMSPLRLTPGAKLGQFREKLQAKIRAKKAKEHEEKMKNHIMYEEEKMVDDVAVEDEEVLEDEFSTESEPEETDEETETLLEARRKKKKKVKSAFVDEEAEVTDEDGEDDDEDESEDESHLTGAGQTQNVEMDDDEVIKKSKFYRRVKAVIEDSSDEEDEVEIISLDGVPPEAKVKGPTEDITEMIVPKKDPESILNEQFFDYGQTFHSDMELFSVSHPAGEQNSQSNTQNADDDEKSQITPAQREIVKLIQEPILLPPSNSQFDEFVSSDPWDLELTKKSRMAASSHLPRFDSEAALDAFKQDICTTQPHHALSKEIAKLVEGLEPQSPDLLTLCSGVFPSQNPATPDESVCNGFNSPTRTQTPLNSDGRSTGNDQTTPRVEREKLKKTRLFQDVEKIESEDEDEVIEAIGRRRLKMRKRRLQLSDDEETREPEEHNDEDEEKILGYDEERGYDSEENEIVVPKKPPTFKGLVSNLGKLRAQFVENEAELSGSEEGSGDEDERGLDEMDEEEGDEEIIDEEALRDEIGKAHNRNMIDDDDRQIRYLQNVLLEDGDLHGEGILREKQFKWKHVDTLDADAVGGDEDAGTVELEDEAERIWKEQKADKARWLKKNSHSVPQEDKDSEEDDSQKIFLENSQYFKLGKSTLKNIQSSCSFIETSSNANSCSEPLLTEKSVEVTTSRKNRLHSQLLLESPEGRVLQRKRGSFLARGSPCLDKLAEITKGMESTNSVKVNSRNFVFSVITPPGPESGNGKRKNFTKHPINHKDVQPKKMPRIERSFEHLDAATKAASIFSQY